MILDKIAEKTRLRVEDLKRKKPLDLMADQAIAQAQQERTANNEPFRLESAIRKSADIAFICELKKASPSRGVIDESFPYQDIALEYNAAGATAISCLTEPYWFLGRDEYLRNIARLVPIPVLRKDFTVDEYQIYEAKRLGASAVLLICAILDTETLRRYIEIADKLGLSALVEAHTADEIRSALDAGARIIGVNNRNLKTFEVDVNTSIRLRELVPPNILFVSESGIRTADDIARLRNIGTNAVLIGESLMTCLNRFAYLAQLRGDKPATGKR